MNYAIYCRKSTDTEDKQVLSLESQEFELRRLAEKENLRIVAAYTESMSAKEPGRPVFSKMLGMIAKGKIDAILCWKIDRLTRNPIDGGQIQWMLQNGKIACIKTFEKNYYPSDNVLLINIEQAMATQYIRDLSVNVKRGNRAKLERGEWPNRAPFGYRNDIATKTIKPDKKTARYVVRAFELYATGGYTLQQIADIFYTEGLRTNTGKKVLKSTLHRIVSNRFYCGLMQRDGVIYKGKHIPLISVELFTHAEDILLGRKHPRPKKHFYHARGFLSCASCGCTLTADTKKGFTYYFCTNGKRICDQHKTYLRSEHIDMLIIEVLKNIAFQTKTITLAGKAYRQRMQDTSVDIEAVQATLHKQKALLAEKEDMLVEGFSSKIIREELYMAKMKDLAIRRAELDQQLYEITAKHAKHKITFEQIENVFLQGNKAVKLYTSATDKQKRILMQNLLSNIRIENKKVLSYQFKSPFDLLAKMPKNVGFREMLPLWDDIRTALVQRKDIG